MLSTLYSVSWFLLVSCIGLILIICVFRQKKVKLARDSSKGTAVVIADRDCGPGYMFAKQLDKMGFTVFAAFHEEKLKNKKINFSNKFTIIKLDITQDEYEKNVKRFIEQSLRRKDVYGSITNPEIILLIENKVTPDLCKSGNKTIWKSTSPKSTLRLIFRKIKGNMHFPFYFVNTIMSPVHIIVSLSKRTLSLIWRSVRL
ncbi:estradiol 17-beta-dehydrogenase 2-like [Acipenser oxyrinchus oxyrinchus]|uniref:Estradiol 17-beta-dehydrogenase 2-like n=1 Tax=Acipenser oxyrinchus oxyrinchus TaxID=40147 RepID=A0AAD8GAC2_ACIOX|nr:estradiol 17-beta-dehydrogenase 2-like [Acipenser oxyrinchus oxyrinchus]